MTGSTIAEIKKIRAMWLRQASALEKKGFEAQKLEDIVQNKIDKKLFRNRANRLFKEADDYRRGVGIMDRVIAEKRMRSD